MYEHWSMSCDRCNRDFGSAAAREQHCVDSARHRLCLGCDFDGESWDELMMHHRKTGHMHDHLKRYNICTMCERRFNSPGDLSHHMMTHSKPSIECLGCHRLFMTYGGMIIHLEQNSCKSGIGMLDLNETAAKCYQWKRYVNSGMRDVLLDRTHLFPNGSPFRCPTCDTCFLLLSALFQHVGTQACSQDMRSGAIQKLAWVLGLQYIHGRRIHARG